MAENRERGRTKSTEAREKIGKLANTLRIEKGARMRATITGGGGDKKARCGKNLNSMRRTPLEREAEEKQPMQ